MQIVAVLLLFLTGALPATAGEQLQSPDGRYMFSFFQKNGLMCYSVLYNGKTVVERGELGVNVDNHLVESAMGVPGDHAHTWTQNMQLTGTDRLTKNDVWHPEYGQESVVRDHYNQLVMHFRKGGGEDLVRSEELEVRSGIATTAYHLSGTSRQKDNGYERRHQYLLDIIIRAYDEGIAIRYHFPEATNGLFLHITEDLTSLQLPAGSEGWQESWAQGPYRRAALLTTEAAWKEESERPLLLHLPGGLYAAVGEAGMHDFVRGKLRLTADNTLRFSLYDSADVISPYDMPWRVIMVGERAVDLINNERIFLNLNAPSALGDASWIRPGKAFRVGLTQKEALQGIDFAADRGMSYIELDAGWYGQEMSLSSSALQSSASRDLDIPALCRYAGSKGIGVWLYVNQRALSWQLDSLLPLYRQWGVSGLKFGFVQVGSYYWTRWLHDAVKKCAQYHLMVDIHDEYRPTGWSRTYPNLMTQEGIRGNEEMPDAEHNTLLPFTRFLCGPADYTLCYFNGRVKNTRAHQLAMSVVYYSPVTFEYWYDNPGMYKGEHELDFWKECPTVWDESRAVDGLPGEYVVQARRSGSSWYVGIMNGLSPRDYTLDTSIFLVKGKKYRVELYQDDPTLKTRTGVSSSVLTVKAGRKLPLHLLASGGAALRFTPTQ